MKRFFLALLLLVFASATAFADSILIGYGPNDGSGDNFGFIIQGQNFFITGGGGTPFDFFNIFPYAPGSTLGGSTDLFMGGGSAVIDGVSYTVFYDVGSLFMSTIVLPTNGRDFNAFVNISFGVSGTLAETNTPISVSGSENGHIYFTYFPGGGFYAAGDFVPVPEPATVILIGTGVVGLFIRSRNRRVRTLG